MARRRDDDQPRLFDLSPIDRALEVVPAAAADPVAIELARRMPRSVHLGTSSWSFSGWSGLVYRGRHSEADLARAGLAAYASHPLLRTVGLDRAFYQPLTVSQFTDLAEQAPLDFRFVVKAHQVVTRPDADDRGRTFGDTGKLRDSGSANPYFLDASYTVDRVVGPACAGLGGRLGPIVFQFPPLDFSASSRVGNARRFLDRLAAFLGALPRGPLYAIEVRNAALVMPGMIRRYSEVLCDAGVAHGFVAHPTMPTLSAQAAALAEFGWPLEQQPCACIRWMLRAEQTYDGARSRYEPFDRIVDPDDATRDMVVDLLIAAALATRPGFVPVNNKAEGSAPWTVRRIAEALAARSVTSTPDRAPPPATGSCQADAKAR